MPRQSVATTADQLRKSSFASCCLWLLTSNLAWTQTIEPPPRPPRLDAAQTEGEQDSTQSLFDGQTLEGWKVLEETVYKRHGKVEVHEGAIRIEAGTPGAGIVWQGEKLVRMNYEIRLAARRVEGSDIFCGLTFPVNDQYCTLVLGGWGGGATGLSNVDNLAAIENQTTDFRDFELGRWYQIKLQVTPEKIQAWIDNEKIVDVVTADHQYAIWWEQEPARPLGIITWYTTAELKDIKLQRLGEVDQKSEAVDRE